MPSRLTLRTGNLSVERIRAAVCGRPLPAGDAERAELASWHALGFEEVEDYVGWCAVEPEEGALEYEHHRANAAAARDAGLGWVPFLWAHALPRWALESAAFVPARCREHGLAGRMPSLYAPGTWALIERFWRTAAHELAGLPAAVAVGFPADYGEVGHGCGMADWLLVPEDGAAHHHPGLWCGEDEARSALPDEPHALARAYRDNVTRCAERLLALAGECFPGVPLEVKLGHGSEELSSGADWDALVRVAARGGATVRSTHSGLLPLFTRRIASLCRAHGARFATEAPRELRPEDLRRRLFVDLAEGTASWFEFPEQHAVVARELAAAAPFARAGGAERAVAALYPRRALDADPGLGTAEALALAHDALAAVCDFAVLDEGQVEAGSLLPFAALVVLDETPGFDPRAAARAWLDAGGVLVLARGGAAPRYTAAAAPEQPPESVRVEPGLEAHRLLLGAGWRFRDDGAPAWGEPTAFAARWTGPRAKLCLQRPARGAELTAEIFAHRSCEVSLHADGVLVARAHAHDTATVAGALLTADGPLVAVEIATEFAERAGGDPQQLGVLVRAVELGPPGVPRRAAPASPRVRCDPRGPGLERAGRGLVLRGDGSPLSALAWLRTWLDGELDALHCAPAPRVERDPLEREWCARAGREVLRTARGALATAGGD